MKILLTGGTGFVGAAVLRRLVDDGHAVTAVVRRELRGDRRRRRRHAAAGRPVRQRLAGHAAA